VDSATGNYFTTPFSGPAMNGTGEISFRGALTDTKNTTVQSYGIYRQSGTGAPIPVALDGQDPEITGGGTYALAYSTSTRVLDSGAVYFWSDLSGGLADYGEFLISRTGAVTVLMTTADLLPEGAKISLRTFHTTGSEDLVGFIAQRTGGGFSIGIHDIPTRTNTIIISDGDLVDQSGGGYRIRLRTTSTVFLNSGGNVTFSGHVIGGGRSFNAIGLRKSDGSLTGIVSDGDYDPGTGMTFSGVTLSGLTPMPMNDANEVVFFANMLSGSNSSFPGLLVRSPGAPAVKVISAMDGSVTFNSNSLRSVSINQAGQVAFLANRTSDNTPYRLYIWTPNGTPNLVAWIGQDLGVGSITGLGYPSFNNEGKVVFMATLAAGTARGGVFIASTTSPPSPVALDGDPAPTGAIGGLFSITSARSDILINDVEDVIFRAEMTGGLSDSGLFVRRHGSTTLLPVALQGQPAPGTGSVFGPVSPSVNNYVAENFQSDSAGEIAFQTRYQLGDVSSVGIWNFKLNNTLKEISVRGIVAPEFGGGIAVSSAPANSWNSGARYPMWVRVSGGSFTEGIMLSVPTIDTPTPAGSEVVVQPVDSTSGAPAPIALTFDQVSQPGQTTVTSSGAGPATPSAFTLGDPPVFYDISTTAAFSGPISVCIDISGLSFPDGLGPRLLHYQNESWIDVTTSLEGNILCGQVSSLSPFTVAQIPPMTFGVTVTPSVLWPANNKLVPITANVQVSQPGAPPPIVELVSITSNEPVDQGDIQVALGTDCRSFQLRASRLGSGNGRTYAITYRATDFVGNALLKTVYVLVPHDQGKK
jgi:hypothetical protein